jgi:hypothetical protein
MNKFLEWLMKTPCQKGEHEFRQFLLESIPPAEHGDMKSNVYGMEIYLEKMTRKVYQVRCKHCGKSPQEV